MPRHSLSAAGEPSVTDDVLSGYTEGSIWVTVAGLVFRCLEGTAQAAVWIQMTDVFGTRSVKAKSDEQSTTTSNEYQTKLEKVTDNLPAGTYLALWSAEFTVSVANSGHKFRVSIDEGALAEEDAPVTVKYPRWYSRAGHDQVSLAAGVHTIRIEYASASPNKTAYIRRARVTLWRVP
jgi:hypothetical protein